MRRARAAAKAHSHKLAADQGYTEAEYNLGVAYEIGEGVEEDVAEATHWFERAAARGFEGAKGALARLRSP